MDRNTLTGLVLIGLVLTIFSIINQPSEEDLKKEKIEAAQKTEREVKEKKSEARGKTAIKTSTNKTGDLANVVSKGEIIRLENEKLIVEFNTKGGIIAAVYLKEKLNLNFRFCC